ncbi:MAG: AMP-binding protein [Spirochaetaceae bacterium]|jgi:acyl-coenzyme A synthetase/AMP-(fatty) acid ligase|nr:AMP-binding protein [Spirochaetaceae bacterium]
MNVKGFCEVFKANKDKKAFQEEGRSITFCEFDALTDTTAALLIKKGAVPGDIIPASLPHNIEAFVYMFGCIKAGVAFCFMDEGAPEENLNHIMKDTNAKFMVDMHFFEELSLFQNFSPFGGEGNKVNSSPLGGEVGWGGIDGTLPAAVYYTSGSTRNSRGVVISRNSLFAVNAGWLNTAFAKGDDLWLTNGMNTFASNLNIVFVALAQGATQHVQTAEMRANRDILCSYIKEHHISAMSMLPSRAKDFLKHGGDGLLRILIIVGEPSVNIYSEKTMIYNYYGATETAAVGTMFKIDKPYPHGTPMGRPMPGSDMRLLDDGEIIVSGPIADGYLHEEKLTRERFIQYEGKTFFRSGDIGSCEDGIFYFIRRKDQQIKIKGHLLEPSDVENALAQFAGVNEAVVKGWTDEDSNVVLYAVITADTQLKEQDIHTALSGKIPDYMIPSRIFQLDKLPLNRNGKIDRRGLQFGTAPNNLPGGERWQGSIDRRKRNDKMAEAIFKSGL